MKRSRRALALVSCLSLCSLVWCVSWAARGPPGRAGAGGGGPSGHTPGSPRLARDASDRFPGVRPAAPRAEVVGLCLGVFRDSMGEEGARGEGTPHPECLVLSDPAAGTPGGSGQRPEGRAGRVARGRWPAARCPGAPGGARQVGCARSRRARLSTWGVPGGGEGPRRGAGHSASGARAAAVLGNFWGASWGPFSRFESVPCPFGWCGFRCCPFVMGGWISPVFRRREERFASKVYGFCFFLNPWYVWVFWGNEIKESLSVEGSEKPFFPPGEFLQKCVTSADLKGAFSAKVICSLLNPDKLGFLSSLFL